MTQPTPRTIGVALTVLKAESALWTEQSERLQQAANDANALLIVPGGVTMVFDSFLDAYNQVTRLYVQRCTDGRDTTAVIATTLAAVATTYAEEEQANLHAQHRLY